MTLKFTVTSNGTQYDRLGVFTFQNTESMYEHLCNWMSLNTDSVWRTSTPEPIKDGIIWTYIKDVTRYIPLFANPGTFILELNNILATGLTGQYASVYIVTLQISVFILQPFVNSNTLCNFLYSFAGISNGRTIKPHCPNLHYVKQLSQ